MTQIKHTLYAPIIPGYDSIYSYSESHIQRVNYSNKSKNEGGNVKWKMTTKEQKKKNTKLFAVNRDTCATADNHSHLIE